MSQEIAEREWQVLRELRPLALERHCERTLADVVRLASDETKGYHERYLAVFKLIEQRDDEIANAFNDVRRSTALQHLACMRRYKLLTDEEMARFSSQTREYIDFCLKNLFS